MYCCYKQLKIFANILIYAIRHILQEEYGLTVESMKIATFHSALNNYGVVDVPPMDADIQSMLEHYLETGGKGGMPTY